ncbi:hypothetical protein [Pedobacter frigiditerrae]|uniref:hypothetical protein n=1 Tax=Pedobacter frigiditerrae TaxID=2530452 RepID=UPI00292D13E4|nr:hypothetical protein [Pedobacter frigiditerrae]
MDFQEFSDYQKSLLPFGQPIVTADNLMHFEFNDDYRDSLLATAEFYLQAIEHHKVYLKIPLGLIFSSEISENAKAGVHEGRGLIVWNGGLLIKQIKLKEKEAKIKYAIEQTELADFLSQLDNPPSTLFFQSLQHFTFYHEFAHVIQLQEKGGMEIMLSPQQNEYDVNKHLLELNADEFSALLLSSHIEQYAMGMFGKVDKENLSKLLSLFLVPILTESISIYPDDLTDFNMEKGSHPHPMVRLLHTVISMIEALNQRHVKGFKLNSKEILIQTMEVASQLTKLDLMTLWKDNLKPIMAYFNIMKDSPFPEGYIDPIDKWNEEIQARQNLA